MAISRNSFAAPLTTTRAVRRSEARSHRLDSRTDHRHPATVHSYRVRVAGPMAAADNEDNEACCSVWLVAVRMTAQPTCVADASRDIVVGSWYCYMTQQSKRTWKCLDSDAQSRSAPLVRPANRAPERLWFEKSAKETEFSTQWRDVRSYMRMSWLAKTDTDCYAQSLPIRFAMN